MFEASFVTAPLRLRAYRDREHELRGWAKGVEAYSRTVPVVGESKQGCGRRER